MHPCTTCGASLPPNAPTCLYCGAPTAAAQYLAAEQARRAAEEQEHARQAALKSLRSLSTQSFVWSLIGLLACWSLIPAVVATVLALRARKLAERANAPLPATAVTGLALGSFGTLFGLACVVMMVVGLKEDSLHERELQRIAGAGADAPTLDDATACALAELRLRKDEWEGSTTFREFECTGRLDQTKDKARLPGVTFQCGKKQVTLVACFERGKRWRATKVAENATCD